MNPAVNAVVEMIAAAHDVGRYLMERSRAHDPRTPREVALAARDLDVTARKLLRVRLGVERPGLVNSGDGGHETSSEGEAFIARPLEGAAHYFRGLPSWCLTLTLVRGRRPIAAVLYSPVLNEVYAAVTGMGATRNGDRIAPNEPVDYAAPLVSIGRFNGRPADIEEVGLSEKRLSAITATKGTVHSAFPGAWQIAEVGGGRLDAYCHFGGDPSDFTGAVLVAEEAGARVRDRDGRPWGDDSRSLVVAAPPLHERLLDLLRG